MRRFAQWLRELLHRYWMKLKLSRFFLFCLGLTIGITFTFCWIEGNEWYDWMMEGRGYALKTIEKVDGSMVTAQAEAAGRVTPEATEPVNLALGRGETSSPAKGIVEKIYILESTAGKFDDKCHRIGGHNGYGFGQGAGRNFCLGSDEEVEKLVIEWFDEKLKTYTVAEATCLYNTGTASPDCPYYQKFVGLN